MNFTEEQKELIKSHLKEYLEETGRSTNKLIRCINPNHADNNPSMSYDPKRNMLHCFSCNSNYDLISLYALDNNLDSTKDFKKIMQDLALKYNINLNSNIRTSENFGQKRTIAIERQDFTKYYKQVIKDADKTDYLEKRCISKDLIKKYNIGYDTKEHEVIIPISKYFYVGRYTEERQGFKHHKPKGAMQELFNADNIRNSNFKSVVFITESIIDALSIETINNNFKTVALNGVTYTKELIEDLKKYNFKGAIILALDTDNTGLNASIKLKEEIEALNIRTFILNTNKESYLEGNKDINDYLIKDKERLENKLNYYNDQIEAVLKKEAFSILEQENSLNYLDAFNEYVRSQDKNKPTPTGIKRLDEALEGGLYSKNLIILGAISSLGKTTLALQIADNIASNNKDVLIFSLEMSKEELIAKSLSRNMYLKALEKNIATYKTLGTRDILKGEMFNENIPNVEDINKLYNMAYEEYKERIANHIYITECNNAEGITIETIEARIKKQIEITEEKPLVVIDYLQIIRNKDTHLTDKQAIDRIVVNLKRIARDNDVTIFLISALNRNSYTEEINLASFRDTSTIEYTADVLIGLQPEVLDDAKQDSNNKVKVNKAQKEEVRTLTLKILKNRNGRIKDVKHINFYAKNNYMHFREYDENFRYYKD